MSSPPSTTHPTPLDPLPLPSSAPPRAPLPSTTTRANAVAAASSTPIDATNESEATSATAGGSGARMGINGGESGEEAGQSLPGTSAAAGTATTTTTAAAGGANVQSQHPHPPQLQQQGNSLGATTGSVPPYTIRKQIPRPGMGAQPSPPSFDSNSNAPPVSSIPKPLAAAPTLLPSTQASPAPPVVTAPSSSTPPPYPALHLMPLNDTFVPKQISLYPPGQRVRIGRQTNAKTIPNGNNGYFDSKVLSRMHAEVWAEDGKVLIRDVKSSNGTFIDGQRLSPEAAESDVFELRTGVTVEFGIDIVSDDGKTIVHHKVAAKVFVVMNADEALASSREFSNWYRYAEQQPPPRRGIRQIGGGSLGGGLGAPQQNGLSIDHFLGKLQTELQKSRDTGSHLNDVSTTLTDVQDTLGGSGTANGPLPPPGASAALFPRGLNGTTNAQQQALAHQQHTQSIVQLQTQLSETQQSLAGHVGKMRDLEGLLAEHEAMKREVGAMRRQMEVTVARQGGEGDTLPPGRASEHGPDRGGRESPIAALLEAQEEDDDDDDDTRSIASVDTVVAGRHSRANGRIGAAAVASKGIDSTRERQLQEQNARLAARLDELAVELDEAIKLGQTLRSQHIEAATTIKKLEEQVSGLEKKVEQQLAAAAENADVSGGKLGKQLESRWTGWKEAFERSWAQEREDWQSEREKLRLAVKEWEERRQMASSDDDGDDDEAGSSGASGGEGGSTLAGVMAGGVAAATVGLAANTSRKNRSKRRRRVVTSSSSTDGVKGHNPETSSISPPLSSRSSSSAVDIPLPSLASPGPARLNKLAREGRTADEASDSDSTIGGRAHAADQGETTLKRGTRGSVSAWSDTGDGQNSRRSFDAGSGGQRPESGAIVIQQRHLTSAVVVVVGIAAAWAVSMKIKD